MIRLNDYLYSGDTILKILRKYSDDLRLQAQEEASRAEGEKAAAGNMPAQEEASRAEDEKAAAGNMPAQEEADCAVIDMEHSRFLEGILNQLEHNDFLTYQSNRIREFYRYMADRYPFLAFTFRGRIKSLIRSEEKFNGYIVEYIYNYYVENGCYPPVEELQKQLMHFRDFIAYRIVISMPKCHLKPGQDREEVEIRYLYEIANALPGFLEAREFTAEPANVDTPAPSVSGGEAAGGLAGNAVAESAAAEPAGTAAAGERGGEERAGNGGTAAAGESAAGGLAPEVRPYFRDYVANPKESGYRSLHIAFYDNAAHGYVEVQLRTHAMDDFAEIGTANHSQYEEEQNITRRRRDVVPKGECRIFDEAYERGMALQKLDLSKIDVNMFTAYSNELMNDCCGLLHGRLILPFEHLSRYQNDLVG